MRVPIAVRVEPYNIETDQPRIDAVRQEFATYLRDLRRDTRAKHGLMGPVGKIFREVKSGRRDHASLKGYALRVHEASGNKPTVAAVEALERAIDLLVGLLSSVPLTSHDRLLDRLDYGLFYQLRKEALESKEARRQAWILFLKSKYGTEESLSRAWNEQVASFDKDLYLPRAAEGSRSKKATPKQRDIGEFWESQGAGGLTDEEEEGDE